MSFDTDIGFLLDTVGDREEEDDHRVAPSSKQESTAASKTLHLEELVTFKDQLLKKSRQSKDSTDGTPQKSLIEKLRDDIWNGNKNSSPILRSQTKAANINKEKEFSSHIEQLGSFRDELLNKSSQLENSTKDTFQESLIEKLRDDLWKRNDKYQLLKDQIERNNTNVQKVEVKPKKLSLAAQTALKKAIVTPDFEQLKSVPTYEPSKKKLQQERKKEREKTKGKDWFGLPATEMTEEVKHDLEILQMRSVLDPKHFYKKNDLNVLPKYFQIGKVMDSPLDFYNNRITKKERKKTLVDELLADAEFQKYNKRKYKEVMQEKQKTHYKSWRKAKRLKKKKN